MSLRKYRTHVADLMGRLGASTRFQAALRARERGWL
jgi:DNA-binding NarL/FixJ family response regulator